MTGTARVVVHERVPPEWARLAGASSLHASPAWLEVMCDRVPGTPAVFVAHDAAGPAAALYATVVDEARSYEAYDLHRLLTAEPPVFEDGRTVPGAGALPRACWFPQLVVALPGHACVVVGQTAALDDVVGATVSWARARSLAAVAFIYTSRDDASLARALAHAGFARFALTHRCVLELPGSGFDDYLASLSHSVRKSARREMRTLERGGVRVRREGVRGSVNDMARLRCELLRRYGHDADEAAEARRLGALAERLDVVAFCARSGPDLLSYALFVAHGGSWWARATGTDHGRDGARFAHFATMFYAPIEHAYAARVRTIDYGVASLEAKRHRGCRLVPLDGWALALDRGLAGALAAPSGATTSSRASEAPTRAGSRGRDRTQC